MDSIALIILLRADIGYYDMKEIVSVSNFIKSFLSTWNTR